MEGRHGNVEAGLAVSLLPGLESIPHFGCQKSSLFPLKPSNLTTTFASFPPPKTCTFQFADMSPFNLGKRLAGDFTGFFCSVTPVVLCRDADSAGWVSLASLSWLRYPPPAPGPRGHPVPLLAPHGPGFPRSLHLPHCLSAHRGFCLTAAESTPWFLAFPDTCPLGQTFLAPFRMSLTLRATAAFLL